MVYGDFESILWPVASFKSNPKRLFTTTTHIHKPFSCAIIVAVYQNS